MSKTTGKKRNAAATAAKDVAVADENLAVAPRGGDAGEDGAASAGAPLTDARPADLPSGEASMNDIARLAGVSQATVSRVLHGGGKVAAAKAEAVLRVAREQGFVPRPRRPRPEAAPAVAIGFLPVTPLATLGAELVLRAVQGVAASLPPGGGLTILPPFADAGALQEKIAAQRLAGILLAGFVAPHGLAAALGKVPHVWLSGRGDGGKRPREAAFGTDALAGAMAARELLAQGAKRLIALAWPACDPGAAERVDGFRFEALRHGVEAQVVAPPHATPAFETAPAAVTRERLAAAFETADCDDAGIFSPDDRLTALLHPLLREWGLFPGRGTRLASCNYQKAVLAPLFPRPASVDLAPELVARQALARLRERIAGFAPSSRVEVVVRPELVPGDPL